MQELFKKSRLEMPMYYVLHVLKGRVFRYILPLWERLAFDTLSAFYESMADDEDAGSYTHLERAVAHTRRKLLKDQEGRSQLEKAMPFTTSRVFEALGYMREMRLVNANLRAKCDHQQLQINALTRCMSALGSAVLDDELTHIPRGTRDALAKSFELLTLTTPIEGTGTLREQAQAAAARQEQSAPEVSNSPMTRPRLELLKQDSALHTLLVGKGGPQIFNEAREAYYSGATDDQAKRESLKAVICQWEPYGVSDEIVQAMLMDLDKWVCKCIKEKVVTNVTQAMDKLGMQVGLVHNWYSKNVHLCRLEPQEEAMDESAAAPSESTETDAGRIEQPAQVVVKQVPPEEEPAAEAKADGEKSGEGL